MERRGARRGELQRIALAYHAGGGKESDDHALDQFVAGAPQRAGAQGLPCRKQECRKNEARHENHRRDEPCAALRKKAFMEKRETLYQREADAPKGGRENQEGNCPCSDGHG